MNATRILASLTLACLPLIVSAQTAGAPGGQASTGTPIEQKPGVGPAAPGSTATSPTATNPTGSLTRGQSTTPGSDTMMNNKSTAKSGKRTNDKNTMKPGEAPTYPAPAPDGTPTK